MAKEIRIKTRTTTFKMDPKMKHTPQKGKQQYEPSRVYDPNTKGSFPVSSPSKITVIPR